MEEKTCCVTGHRSIPSDQTEVVRQGLEQAVHQAITDGYSLSSGLRAAGDIKFNLYSSIFSSVICRVALSFLFGLVFNMGVIGITIAMACDWGIKAALVVWRWKSGKWKQFRMID